MTAPPELDLAPARASASAATSEVVLLLQQCAQLGIAVRPDGETLYVSAPGGRLPAELRARIQERKRALLDHLATYRCSSQRRCAGAIQFREPTVCFWCREVLP